MVYESDFYTTRRPYSRPLASSYSVTPPPVVLPLSSIIQLRGYLPRMPYIAHKKLVTVVHSPVHNVYYAGSMIPIRIHSRVRPSVLTAELKRIRDLPRSTTCSYTDHFLNSKDHIYFDDEAKEIRARVDSLLRRVHVYVPRASPSDFAEEIVPERMRSGDYVRRLLSGKNNTKKDAEPVSWYDVPERGHFGNLACVKYVAGKPHSVRRPYYKVADLRPSDIKNDVNFLSYYQKNRQAAAKASPDQPMTERELRKARALETERTEPIVKREVKPTLEKKIITATEEKKKPEQVEKKIVAEEKNVLSEVKKSQLEEMKPIEEEKNVVTEEIKAVAEEKKPEPEEIKQVAEEKKIVVEEPVKEEVKPKVKAVKESKVKKPKEVEKKVETPKTKEVPVKEPTKEPELVAEPVKEPTKEPELVAEPVKEKEVKVEAVPVESPAEPTPKPVEVVEEPVKQESTKEEPPKDVPSEPEVAQVKEPENVPENVPETKPEVQAIDEPKVEPTVEPTVEPEVEQVIKTAVGVPEFIEELKPETIPEVEAKPVEEPGIVDATPASSELVSEKEQPEDETEEVKQEKQDAARRAEEYLRRVADEARTEEEKRKAAEDERTRLELEEKKVWEAIEIDFDRKAHLDEILAVERAEAERKLEEEQLLKEHNELLRLEQAERQINEEKLRKLMEEEERMLIEERAEEVRQRQEMEERLAEVARGVNNEKRDPDLSHEDHMFTPITDQDLEEKPYEVQSDEDTRIEEEDEEVECNEVEEIVLDPYVLSETECAESRPGFGGGTANEIEEDFVWPDEEA